MAGEDRSGLTSALNGASKHAQRGLRASVFERAVRQHFHLSGMLRMVHSTSRRWVAAILQAIPSAFPAENATLRTFSFGPLLNTRIPVVSGPLPRSLWSFQWPWTISSRKPRSELASVAMVSSSSRSSSYCASTTFAALRRHSIRRWNDCDCLNPSGFVVG